MFSYAGFDGTIQKIIEVKILKDIHSKSALDCNNIGGSTDRRTFTPNKREETEVLHGIGNQLMASSSSNLLDRHTTVGLPGANAKHGLLL